MAAPYANQQSFIWKIKKAVVNNDVVAAKRLFKGGLDINALYWDHTSCLHEAILSGSAEMVKMLIQAGADVNIKTEPDGRTPLHYACRSGNEDIVDALLKAGCIVNTKTRQDFKTPLHSALWKQHENIIIKLLNHGADPNIQDEDGWAALHWAVRSDKLAAVVSLMLEKGANMNATIKRGVTPLHMSIESQTWPALCLLLLHGADVENDFQHVASFIISSWSREASFGLVKLLQQTGLTRYHKELQHINFLTGLDYDFTLMSLSRAVIRRTLSVVCRGRSILSNLDCLEIPVILKDYLKLSAELDTFRNEKT